MNPVQKSLSKLFGAWLAVRDTVDDGHCDCIEKADVSSEHRDESNFTELPAHRDQSKFKKSHHSGQTVLYAVLAATTAGRAKVIVREDATKHGAWAWAWLRERFGRDSEAASFTEVFSIQLAERERFSKTCGASGQEGLEASTRVTELTNDRSTGDQQIVTTWSARA